MQKENINLSYILEEIENDAINDLQSEQKDIDENFNEIAKKRAGIANNMWMYMLKKLLKGLQIEISVKWHGKIIFTKIIP